MQIFDTIAEKLGTTRHTAMVLVLLVVLAAAWYISRHLPAVGGSTADTTTSPTTMANNHTANDTSYDSAANLGKASSLPVLPPTPNPNPYQGALPPQPGLGAGTVSGGVMSGYTSAPARLGLHG